jgi:hypothetical protein
MMVLHALHQCGEEDASASSEGEEVASSPGAMACPWLYGSV